MFKTGDKVKKKNGESFANGKKEATVALIIRDIAVFKETGSRLGLAHLELADTSTVDRPDSDHYHEGGIDVWQFADANFDYDELFGFHKINVIKYIVRFGKKNGRNIRDLEKARAVLDEMIRMELSK